MKEFLKIVSRLNIARRPVLSLTQISDYLNRLLTKEVNLDDARTSLGALFDEEWEKVRLANNIGGLPDLMFDENYALHQSVAKHAQA